MTSAASRVDVEPDPQHARQVALAIAAGALADQALYEDRRFGSCRVEQPALWFWFEFDDEIPTGDVWAGLWPGVAPGEIFYRLSRATALRANVPRRVEVSTYLGVDDPDGVCVVLAETEPAPWALRPRSYIASRPTGLAG